MNKKNRTNFISNFRNQLIVLLLKGISLLPFGVLYVLSDFFFILNKYIIKYRYRVTTENLQCAFPEKPQEEIQGIRDKFYRHFCDISLESIKLHSLSQKQMEKRVKFKGTDLLNKYARKGEGVVLLAYHYNNWECGSYLQSKVDHRFLMVYNKMRNNVSMDNFLLHSRERWGGRAVQMGRAAKTAFHYKRSGVPALLVLLADQSALASSQAWCTFLNREAAFFTGPEKIAHKTNQPVFVQHIRKLERGKYEFEYVLIVEEPAKVKANHVLLAYVREMEKTIKYEPEYYLWSHRRWKHTRPEGIELIK